VLSVMIARPRPKRQQQRLPLSLVCQQVDYLQASRSSLPSHIQLHMWQSHLHLCLQTPRLKRTTRTSRMRQETSPRSLRLLRSQSRSAWLPGQARVGWRLPEQLKASGKMRMLLRLPTPVWPWARLATGGTSNAGAAVSLKDRLPVEACVLASEARLAPEQYSSRLMDELLAEPEPRATQREDAQPGRSDPGLASDSVIPGEETQRDAFGEVERILGVMGLQASSQPSFSIEHVESSAGRGSAGPGSVAGGEGVGRAEMEVSTGNAQERKQVAHGMQGPENGAQSARAAGEGNEEQGVNQSGEGWRRCKALPRGEGYGVWSPGCWESKR